MTLDYIRLLAFQKVKAYEEFDALRKNVAKNKGQKELKTMYYFYEDNFQLMDMLEKLAKKYLKGKTGFEEILHIKSTTKANETDRPVQSIAYIDDEEIKRDLIGLKRDVQTKDHIARKINGLFFK